MHKPVLIFIASLLYASAASSAEMLRLNSDTPLRDVIYVSDPESDLITVGMIILAGEADSIAPEGLSHYLEHLVFWHADTLGDETMHNRGGNAWVNGIVTVYYNVGEKAELEDMLKFASRVLTPPASKLSFMQEERDVVAREYDLRMLENPTARVLSDMRKLLYADHPVSRSVIGTLDSIASLSVEQALDFHDQYYTAANAVLFISGNLVGDELVKLIERQFSSFPESEPYLQPWREKRVDGGLDETRDYPVKQRVSSRLVYASLSTLPETIDAVQLSYTTWFVEQLLNSALPGSLAKPLRLDNFILSEFYLEIYPLLRGQVELVLIGPPDVGITLDKAQSSLQEALAQIGLAGVPTDSFERVRQRLLQTARREGRKSDTHLIRAFTQLSLGIEPVSESEHLSRIEAVSKQDVDQLLQALGNPQRRVSGHITGENTNEN